MHHCPTAACRETRHRRPVPLVAALAIFAAACAPTTRVESPLPVPTPDARSAARVADTVWYISVRARVEGRDTRRFADSLEYGYVVHSYRRRADVLVDDLDMALDDSVRLTPDEFVVSVRFAANITSAPDNFAVLYVHGYSTSLHECWRYVAEAHARSRSDVPWVAFCWPSNGAGVAAPARGAIFDRAYRDDSTNAVASQPVFARAAHVVLDAVPPARLLLVAHSMGAQLLSGTLMDTTQPDNASLRARLTRERARGIAFVAPDIDADRFADHVVAAISPLTSRLVAYTSGRDRMLTLSRQRSGTPRAGLRTRTPLTRSELETVDVTDGVVAESSFQRIFGTHHSIRRASALVFDLIHIVGAGREPACRATLGTAALTAGVWVLTPGRPALNVIAEQCALMKRAP